MSTVTASLASLVAAATSAGATAATPETATAKTTMATRIVELVLEQGAEAWHTPTGDPYISLLIGGHCEHYPLSARAVRDYLSRLHHDDTGRVPGAQAIADAITALSGRARFDGATHEVHVRVAGHAGRVYLDLGDPPCRVIEIDADGWRHAVDPPVRFRRGRALLPLPEPVMGGSIDALRDVIHVSGDDDWRLIEGWLIGALRPVGPYPLLALDGEQGAGKSTFARMVRRLIDPSSAELRAEPREIRDLMVAAPGGRIIALDNLSSVRPWLSDALCRLSTGGALSTRQLYTDGDEHILEAVRPVILTGITSVITRGDLADRAIPITLPAISEAQRRTEADLWAAYEALRPAVLGALLDAVACALRREQEIQLGTLPRMADWARWVTAAAPALHIPDRAILNAYTRGRLAATEAALDGDALAIALRALDRPYVGTAADLLTRITPTGKPPRGWPESPRGLSGALRRLAPQLRRVGIDINLGRREPHTGRRLIHIGDVGEPSSSPSPPSPSSDPLVESGDGPLTTGHLGDGRAGQPSPENFKRHRSGDDGDDGGGPAPALSHEPYSEPEGPDGERI
jgi:energy-coupling factor transporter ATP-binding protein EcfA2